jgi:hypothetical protein
LIAAATDGDIEICGEPIIPYFSPATGVNHDDSPVEALCQANAGDFRSQVVFHLTAAALNCLANGHLDDCSDDPLFGTTFAECNVSPVCDPTSDANKAAQANCVSKLDCLNNGGHPAVDVGGNFLFCASGNCSDNGEWCTPNNKSLCDIPGEATCVPAANCHTLDLPDYPNPGPAGSPKACNDAAKTACTIFSAVCPVP